MKTRISLKFVVILVLLVTGIVMTTLSVSLFLSLDHVVNGDLYRYGLHFDYEWATKYWTNARLTLGFLEAAMMATGIAIASAVFSLKVHEVARARLDLVCSLLLIAGIVMTGVSAFFFNQVDHIVQGELYRYGLQFSYEWAVQYWTYSKAIVNSLEIGIATMAISIGLILIGARPREVQLSLWAHALLQINPIKIVSFLLFSAGMIALAFSINYVSSILAFIGLGLVFWGAILFYVRPEKYIKETLFARTTLPALEGLDQLLGEIGYKGKGIYLPPKYLKDFESSKVYIGARENTKLPTAEQMEIQGERILLENPEGLLIAPPGAELVRFFEETLGISFTRVDLEYLEQNMSKLLIEDLEIAQNLEIEIKNNRVNFKIENSIYKNTCKEASKLSKIFRSLGCPLCSAIACALAKASGKPVIIEKDQISEDGLITDIEYRLLEETP